MGTGTPVNTGDTIQAAKMNLKLETIGDIGQLPVRWTRPGRIYASDGITLKQPMGSSYTSAVTPEDGDRFQCFLVGDGTETKYNLHHFTNPDSGIFDIYINGTLAASGRDNYNADYSSINRQLNTNGLIVPGANIIEMRVNGKNPLSTGYSCETCAVSIQ